MGYKISKISQNFKTGYKLSKILKVSKVSHNFKIGYKISKISQNFKSFTNFHKNSKKSIVVEKRVVQKNFLA